MNSKSELCLADRLWQHLGLLLARNRIPFLTALLTGLAAHGFAFTNKLVNHDEIESLFGKGATITSGRWGLELVKVLFPDWSMPWIYGIISLLLIAAAVCLLLNVLEIRSRTMQILAAALTVSFPSLTGNFCFMFTSTAYAWAFFLSVLSVYEFCRGGWGRCAVSAVLCVLALGIYQAYIAVAASLYVLLMLRQLLDGEGSIPDVVLFGLRALAVMAAAIALYYGAVLLSFCITGEKFNTYVTENVNGSISLTDRVRLAYDSFLYVFTFRNFYLVSTETSRYIHIVFAGLILMGTGALAFRIGKPLRIAAVFAMLALLPLSISCMYLIMSPQSIHTLVLYSFIAVYLSGAMVLERLVSVPGAAVRQLSALLLAVVVVCNMYFSNMVYLKLKLQYENAFAFYSGLITRVEMTEGFDENCCLAIVGKQDNLLHNFPELDTELLMGPPSNIINIYSRENFIRYYLGVDLPFADAEETEALENDPQVAEMAEYPYDGSVERIGDTIVVKLG